MLHFHLSEYKVFDFQSFLIIYIYIFFDGLVELKNHHSSLTSWF